MVSKNGLCRLCAKSTDYLIPIFEAEGAENNLREIIEKYVPISISPTDTLPLLICYQCAMTLLYWKELTANCIKSEQILISKLGKENNKEEGDPVKRSFQSLSFNTFFKEQKALSNPDNFAKTCLAHLDASSTLCKNADLHQKPQTPSSDLEEIVSDNDNTETIQNYDSSDNVSNEMSLETLRNIYSAVYNLKNHFDKIHEKRKYRDCLSSSDSSSDNTVDSEDVGQNGENSMKYDDLTMNNRRRDFFDVDTRDELNKARTIVNGKCYYVCPICGKDLHSTHTYIFHKRIHSGEKPCVCHLCGKQFRVNAGLQRHVKETHYKIKMHACDTCGRSFVNRQNLIQHLRIHTGERPYVCSQCGKRFKQSGSLYIHSKTHTDYYPFQCNTCSAKFRQRSGLTHHMYKHTGEKPNVCNYCGKAYRVKHELNIHMLIHTDQRPYVCPVCGQTFRQRRTMRNHCKKLHDCEL